MYSQTNRNVLGYTSDLESAGININGDGSLTFSTSITVPVITCDTINAVNENIENITIENQDVTGFVHATGDVISNYGTDSYSLNSTAQATATNSTSISTLNGQMSTANTNITNLQSSVSTNTSNISTLQSGLSSANSNISQNTSDIGSALTQIAQVNANVVTNTNNISSLQTSVSNNATDITVLEAKTRNQSSIGDGYTNFSGNVKTNSATTDNIQLGGATSGNAGSMAVLNASGNNTISLVGDTGTISASALDAPEIDTLQEKTRYINGATNNETKFMADGAPLPSMIVYNVGNSTDVSMATLGGIHCGGTVIADAFYTNSGEVFIGIDGNDNILSVTSQGVGSTQDVTADDGLHSLIETSQKVATIGDKLNPVAFNGLNWNVGNKINVGVEIPTIPNKPTFNGTTYDVNSETELTNAYNNAVDGDIINIVSNIDLLGTFSSTKRLKWTSNNNSYLSFNGSNLSTLVSNSDNCLFEALTIKSLGTSSNEVGLNLVNTSSTNNHISGCLFEVDEVAIQSAGQTYIYNCVFRYARQPANESHRYINIIGINNEVIIDNCIFNGSTNSTSSSSTQAVFMNGPGINYLNGQLVIQNCTSGGTALQRLLMIENNMASANAFKLYVINNDIITGSGYCIFYSNPLFGISEIWAVSNKETQASNLVGDFGKGIIGIDAPSAGQSINSLCKIYARYNQPIPLRADYQSISSELNNVAVSFAKFSVIPTYNNVYEDNIKISSSLSLPEKVPESYNLSNGQLYYSSGELNVRDNDEWKNILDPTLNISNITGLQTELDSKLNTSGGTITNDLVVGGNLTINGTTTTVNSNVNVYDYIEVTQNTVNNKPALKITQTAGGPTFTNIMEVIDGDSNIKFILSQDCDVNVSNKLTIDSSTGNLNSSGNGVFSGSVNADSFTTSNTINAVGVNGKGTFEGGLRVGTSIEPQNAGAIIDASQNTSSIILPKGNSSERPSGVAGMLRYNTQSGEFEGFTTEWGSIGGGGDFAPVITNPSNGDTLIYNGTNWVNQKVWIDKATASVNSSTGTVSVSGTFQSLSPYYVSETAREYQVNNTNSWNDPMYESGEIGLTTYTPSGLTDGTWYARARRKSNWNVWSEWSLAQSFAYIADVLRQQLSTSVAAYDAASVGALVPITANEYTNLMNTVSGSQIGVPEISANWTTPNFYGSPSAGVNSSGTAKVPTTSLPADWVYGFTTQTPYAFKVALDTNAGSGTNFAIIFTNSLNSLSSSPLDYWPLITDRNGVSGMYYYVRKKAPLLSNLNGTGPKILGMYFGLGPQGQLSNVLGVYTRGNNPVPGSYIQAKTIQGLGATYPPSAGYNFDSANNGAFPLVQVLVNTKTW